MTHALAGDLVLVGAGGFGRETVEAVRAMAAAGASWRMLGFLDEDPVLSGTFVDDIPVLGGIGTLASMPDTSVVVCTGRPGNYRSRRRIVESLGLPAERFATIVHPAAAVSASSHVGPGSVLLAHAALTAAVSVGQHVAVMPHVTLTHDDVVEDFATVAAGVRLGGGVRIGRGAYIGAGALIREGLTVGPYALVGMGAVVTRDVPAGEVWAGCPARRLRAATVQGAQAAEETPDPRQLRSI